MMRRGGPQVSAALTTGPRPVVVRFMPRELAFLPAFALCFELTFARPEIGPCPSLSLPALRLHAHPLTPRFPLSMRYGGRAAHVECAHARSAAAYPSRAGLTVAVHLSGLPEVTARTEFPGHAGGSWDHSSRPDPGDVVHAFRVGGAETAWEELHGAEDPFQVRRTHDCFRG